MMRGRRLSELRTTIALLGWRAKQRMPLRLRYPVVEVLGLEPRGAGGFKGLAPRPATPESSAAL